jgi:hypothetical protein
LNWNANFKIKVTMVMIEPNSMSTFDSNNFKKERQ